MDATRKAEPADVAAARQCIEEAYATYVPRLGFPPAPMSVDYEVLQSRGELFVVGDPPVGTVTLTVQDTDLWINNLAVRPERQGQGLGRALIAFAESEAVARKATSLRLFTNELMTENLTFYGALGFREIGRHVDGPYRCVVMEREAQPPQRTTP